MMRSRNEKPEETLIRAWQQGRPIVFFLGSGISVGSGFPTIQKLCAYLAQLKFAFKYGLYSHRSLGLDANASSHDVSPAELIQLFDWPAPERLAADVWRWLEETGKVKEGSPGHPAQFAKWKNDLLKDRWLEEDDPRFVAKWKELLLREGLLETDELDALRGTIVLKRENPKDEPFEPDWLRRLRSLPKQMVAKRREWLQQIEQLTYAGEVADRYDQRLAKLAARSILHGSAATSAKETFYSGEPSRFGLRGDWEDLLDSLTEGSSDYVDALFATLGRRRKPELSHLMLAHLVRKFGVQLILTTNFDRLVETAMYQDGLSPEIFDVFRDAAVPHPHLILGRLSIVKLHGSAYGLRVGERLRNPLDSNTRERVLGCIPERSLVVVLGFSGWERRMMQLIEAFLRREEHAKEIGPRVLWLTPDDRPTPPERLKERLDRTSPQASEGLVLENIRDAGTFLATAYFRFSSSYPVSRTGYRTSLPILPRCSEKPQEEPDATLRLFVSKRREFDVPSLQEAGSGERSSADSTEDDKFYADLANAYLWPPDTQERLDATLGRIGRDAGLAMAAFAASKRRDYDTIWIDLEEHHTVEGVVAELLEKIRRFDPDIPNLILPSRVEASDETEADASGSSGVRVLEDPDLEKACERVWEALSRRRYVVCFFQLDCFGRPHTVHHGTPSIDARGRGPHEVRHRYRRLVAFLSRLTGLKGPNSESPRDVYYAVSIDVPRQRHFLIDSAYKPLNDQLTEPWKTAVRACGEFVQRVRECESRETADDTQAAQGHCRPVAIVDDFDNFFPESERQRFRNAGSAKEAVRRLLKYFPSYGPEGFSPDQKAATFANHEDAKSARHWFFKATIDLGWISQNDLSRLQIDRADRNTDDTVDAAFAALAVSRRPRSLVAVRGIIATHFGKLLARMSAPDSEKPHEDGRPSFRLSCAKTDAILKRLEREAVVHLFEGGTIWIDNVVHQLTYKLISDRVRESTLQNQYLPDLLDSQPATVERVDEYLDLVSSCLTLTYWHRRTARFLYSSVYLPSGDLQAFWEYVYHRVAGVRYLTSAEAILVALKERLRNERGEGEERTDGEDVTRSFAAALRKALERLAKICASPTGSDDANPELFGSLKRIAYGEAKADETAFLDPFWKALVALDFVHTSHIARLEREGIESTDILEASLETLAKLMSINRHIHIVAIRKNFERTRAAMLAALPSETMLGWISQLTEVDIPAMKGTRTCPLGDAYKSYRDEVAEGCGGHSIQHVLWDLEKDLRNLRGVVTFLRRDYEACFEHAWDFWRHSDEFFGLFRNPTLLRGPQDEKLRAWKELKRSFVDLLLKPKDSNADRATKGPVPTAEDLEHVLKVLRISFPKAAASDANFLVETFCKWIEEGKQERDEASQARLTEFVESVPEKLRNRSLQMIDAIRRSANCLGQLGMPKEATQAFALADAFVKYFDGRLNAASKGHEEGSESKRRELFEQRLANSRRRIDFVLANLLPWSGFDAAWSPDGDSASDSSSATSDSADERTAENAAKKAANELRRENRHRAISDARRLARSLEEAARDSTDAAGTYFEYRSEALALLGRAAALHSDFKIGHRSLDRAQAGLDLGSIRHRTIAASIHLYRAEALAMSAARTVDKRDFTPVQRLTHARALLERADEDLRNCEEELAKSRRDMTTWIFLRVGQAQLAIEHLLLDIDSFVSETLPPTWTYRQYSAVAERRVDQGLSALRQSLDFVPFRSQLSYERSQTPQHYPERKSIAIFLQLFVATDLALWLARAKEAILLQTGQNQGFSSHAQLIDRLFEHLAPQQQLHPYLDQWVSWCRTHRFNQFADFFQPPHGPSDFASLWGERRRTLFGKIREPNLRHFILEEMSKLIRGHSRTLWEKRHPTRF